MNAPNYTPAPEPSPALVAHILESQAREQDSQWPVLDTLAMPLGEDE